MVHFEIRGKHFRWTLHRFQCPGNDPQQNSTLRLETRRRSDYRSLFNIQYSVIQFDASVGVRLALGGGLQFSCDEHYECPQDQYHCRRPPCLSRGCWVIGTCLSQCTTWTSHTHANMVLKDHLPLCRSSCLATKDPRYFWASSFEVGTMIRNSDVEWMEGG